VGRVVSWNRFVDDGFKGLGAQLGQRSTVLEDGRGLGDILEGRVILAGLADYPGGIDGRPRVFGQVFSGSHDAHGCRAEAIGFPVNHGIQVNFLACCLRALREGQALVAVNDIELAVFALVDDDFARLNRVPSLHVEQTVGDALCVTPGLELVGLGINQDVVRVNLHNRTLP